MNTKPKSISKEDRERKLSEIKQKARQRRERSASLNNFENDGLVNYHEPSKEMVMNESIKKLETVLSKINDQTSKRNKVKKLVKDPRFARF